VYVEDGPGSCYWLQYSFCCILYNDKTPVIDRFPAVNVQILHVYSMDSTKS